MKAICYPADICLLNNKVKYKNTIEQGLKYVQS